MLSVNMKIWLTARSFAEPRHVKAWQTTCAAS
ncbi:hypothetical protein X566_06295 [Afipia sp. P52-10]|nr:hypothetical protein X566_06295 [Afipia sp. P52-10]